MIDKFKKTIKSLNEERDFHTAVYHLKIPSPQPHVLLKNNFLYKEPHNRFSTGHQSMRIK